MYICSDENRSWCLPLDRPVWLEQRPDNGRFHGEQPVEDARRGTDKGRAPAVGAVTHLERENIASHIVVERLQGSLSVRC